MDELERALQILRGSKRFDFHGTVLTVTDYYTGDSVSLDLGKLTEEMLEELQPDPEEEEDGSDW